MDEFKRILVVTPAQLGDVLLCTPMIHAARQRWPDAQIDVLGFQGTLELLAGNSDVNRLIEVPHRARLVDKLREAGRLWRRYDLALVTRSSDRAHLYGWVAARVRSALLPASGTGSAWKRRAASHGVVPAYGTPEVLAKLALLEPWVDPPVTLSVRAPTALALAAPVAAQLHRPCVVVQIPSMWRYKQWPTAHYRRIVQALLADGAQVVLTGSGSANDQALVAQVRDAGSAPDLLDLSGQLNLRQVCALLQRADAYLGPDTSVTHLAVAVGVPVVSVFGPSLPNSFGPWPAEHPATAPWQPRAQRQQVGKVVLLQGPDLPGRQCVPCNRMGCEHRPDSASRCLEGLAPERVLAELRRMLGDAASRR